MINKEIQDVLNERDKYKNIIEKASKDLNITPEMLIAEFDRLEDLEDDREQLKWRLKEEKEKVEKQQKEIEKYKNLANENLANELIFRERICPEDAFIIQENYIHKDKIRELIKENAYPDTYNFKTIEVSKLEKLLEEN